jgi:hypothetical protein
MKINIIPVIVNGEITTNNNKVLTSGIISSRDSDKVDGINTKNKKKTPENKVDDLSVNTSKNKGNHTKLIIGYSHARECASKVKDNFHETYNVTGIVKPRANVITFRNSVKDTVLTLWNEDVLVFCGDANDVSKSNTKEGLRHILNFVRNNTHTNIVLLSIPYRHDLVSWSCINKEITAFNRKLFKTMKCHEHVIVTNYDLNRQFFTKHLNKTGKEVITKHVPATCVTILHHNVQSLRNKR